MKRFLSVFLSVLVCGIVEACVISVGPSAQPVIGPGVINNCIVSWTSDCIGNGDVRYGLDPSSLPNYQNNSIYAFSHSVTVQRLPANTVIYYIVETTGRGGVLLAQSCINNFTTLSLSPTPTPTIANTPTETPTDTPTDTPTPTPTP